MRRLLDLPIRAPRATLAVLLVLTAFFAFFARSIRVDSAIENLLPSNDPDRLYYDGVRKAFGSEEATVIGVFADDVFAPQTLATIDALSAALAKIDGVREVLSLTTVKGVESGDSGIRVGRLMRRLPETPAAAADFRRKVLADPLYAANLVSDDRTATPVLVLFEPLSDEEFLRRGIETRIRDVVQRFGDADHFAITGIQTLKVQGARLMERDMAAFVPLSILIVVVVLVWAFRTVRGVLVPLAAVIIGVIWTTGFMVLDGSAINMGTLILPPLLMAIGIAYAIHLVSRYYQELTPGRTRRQVVEAAMEHARLPVGIAALTTLLGFASLTTSHIRAIRDFGFYSVFGIGAIYVISIAFVPAALVLLPAARRKWSPRDGEGWVTVLLERLGRISIHHRWAVLFAASAICALSLWGVRRIRVETDYLGFFSPASQVRRENARIAERLGGTQPIYVVVDGDGPGSVARLDTLGAVRDLQAFIAEQPGVDTSLSFADYLSVVWHAVNPDATADLPETQADVDQLMLFVDPAELAPVVTRDLSRANIVAGTHLSGSAEVADFARRVEDYARTRFRRGIEVRATGTLVLLNRSADALARGQIFGLAQVLIVLLVLMSLMFLSLRSGLLSLVPNVFPIIVLFGVMGWSGISLNISTSMIAVIAIGIAVDDTIHYLSAFNARIRATGNPEDAILYVGRTVGRPIVFTSIALAAGFLVVCLSNFQPIQYFGVLASVTMVVALFADLILLPALVMTTTIITVWDLMYVKLGPEPHRQVPLFAGLRPFQAKIVVLMARLTSAPPGTFITRYGELKSELYVLLSGRVDVSRHGGEGVIRSLGRGAVIGEMGLVRQRPRSADVVTSSAVEYLLLDGDFLRRIERRHPRIAAKVFLNLTRVLSDRLESTTDELVALRQRTSGALPIEEK